MRIKLIFLSLICVLAMGVTSAYAVAYLDDFSSGSLAAYTQTDILAQGANGAVQFTSTGGNLSVTRSTGTYPEQKLLLINSSLDIGEILRLDTACAVTTGYADLGIAVSATVNPPYATYSGTNVDTRQNFFDMYLKNGSSGWGNVYFNPNTQPAGQNGYVTNQANYASVTGLWIYHKSLGVFDIGYSIGAIDTQFRELTGVSWDTGSPVIGLYTDLRTVQTYGTVDNLRVVPEPSTTILAISGLIGMGLIWLRKRK
jgi:hypothetical protein